MTELTAGDKAPDVFNIVIEIRRGERNKYEMDKETGRLTLDRVNATMLGYPTDYGYVPQTLCEDGDPIDALLVIDESVPHGVVVPARTIGVLYMVDGGESDEKLICVASSDITKDHIQEVDDLGPTFKPIVEHYYARYKDWKKSWQGEDIKFNGWGDAAAARKAIEKSIKAYDHK